MSAQSDPTQWATVITAATSAIALAISIWSAYTARQSLKVAAKQFDAHKPNLSLYLQNGFVRERPSRQSTAFALLVSVSNLSDADNSLSLLELAIQHHAPSGMPLQTALPHDATLAPVLGATRGITPLTLPAYIRGHQTIAGWALFELPAALLHDTPIDRYGLVATDTHSLKYHIEVSNLTEIMNGKVDS